MSDEFVIRERSELFKIATLDRYMAGHSGFIAGGCIKNIFNNERIKDIDIFFENQVDFYKAVTYFQNNKDFKKHYENEGVIAFKEIKSNQIIELIKKTFGTPEQIISKFDFSITKFAYYKEISDNDSVEYKIIHHKNFFEHLFLKKLVLNKEILFPVSTFERSLRYAGYGYGLCRESKANLLNAIKNTNDTNDISKNLYFGLD